MKRNTNPGRCNDKVYRKGTVILVLYGNDDIITNLVNTIRKKADANVDWHIFAGRAVVLHLGDAESRARVETAINELVLDNHGVRIVSRYAPGESTPRNLKPGQTVLG